MALLDSLAPALQAMGAPLPDALATPLAIWGKLPSHGEYLCHRASPEQARDWQLWVGRVWGSRPSAAQRPPRGARRGETGWLSLEPRPVVAALAEVPVAFVLQPGALHFAPRHCVQGVLLASQDRFGRPCPLIIFQQLAPGWLRRSWRAPPPGGGLLFWLARIAARTQGGGRSWDDLTRAVDALWQLHRPGWRQCFGRSLAPPPRERLETLLAQYCAQDHFDTACGLRGVRNMPWAGWPRHILEPGRAGAAFWQQDLRGGYVNASDDLARLWGAPA